MPSRLWFVIILCALTCGPARAAATRGPAQLYGKSVIVKWQETRVQRNEGASQFQSIGDDLELSLYVSSEGRVFSRLTHNVNGKSGASEEVAGVAGSSNRVVSFNGASLTVIEPFVSGGARRIAVDFDAGFASCTANTMFGKKSGSEIGTYWSPIIKMNIEIQSATVLAASCSVRDGNVFGWQ